MKILIVDDNRDSRTILGKTLEHHGYNVSEASNGREALEAANNTPPDMIISDILMPEMDGFKLCHEVKNSKKLRKIPFVFYSATFTDSSDEELAMNLGASKFIHKPIETDKFIDIIGNIIHEHEEDRLHVPRMPLEEPLELSRMYKESIARKLDQKIQELQLYREIFINANDAIAILDEHGRYVSQNAAHRAIVGYSDEELRGMTPAIHIGKEVFTLIMDKLSANLIYRGELISHAKSGVSSYIELSAFPVTNERGQFLCYVGISRDITQRKKMEEELKQRVRELEEFHDITIGRELKMKELKAEIERLKSRLNELGVRTSD